MRIEIRRAIASDVERATELARVAKAFVGLLRRMAAALGKRSALRSVLKALAALLLLALPLGAADVRLVEPRDGARLAGGATVSLAWTADRLPPRTEEWEAFLSVDGGRYFGTRITPHLDLDLRRTTFTVPNVGSSDVRILLRVGDEEEEHEVAFASRFSIRFDPGAPPHRAVVTNEEGEPARAGAPGVAVWVAGPRDGTQAQSFARPAHALTSESKTTLHAGTSDLDATEDSSAASRPALVRVVRFHTRVPRQPLLRTFFPHDLLLVTRRLNI